MEWRPIPDLPDYEVSESGQVRRVRAAGPSPQGKVLSGTIRSSGRRMFKLRDADGGIRYELASWLVARAFIGPRPAGPNGKPMQCLHRDGNPTNDHRSNLYWGTHQQNMDDRERHGRTARGESQGRAKLTSAAVVSIRELWASGTVSMEDLAAAHGVSDSLIDHVVHGRNWREAGGPISRTRRCAA